MCLVRTGQRELTVCRIYEQGKSWPSLRLRGAWLRELGFEAGSGLEVECSQGMLFIRLAAKGEM